MYRATEQPTATPISTPTPPGFESILVLMAIVVVTLSFFLSLEKKEKNRRGKNEKKTVFVVLVANIFLKYLGFIRKSNIFRVKFLYP